MDEIERRAYFAAAARKWRLKHPEFFKDINRKNVRRIRQKRKSKLDELRKIGCSRCGVTQGIRLCFHHIEGNKNKEFNLSSAQTFSQERIDEELKKCEILCNSCHMKLHNPQQFRVYTRKRA
jgi:hypothetical protein